MYHPSPYRNIPFLSLVCFTSSVYSLIFIFLTHSLSLYSPPSPTSLPRLVIYCAIGWVSLRWIGSSLCINTRSGQARLALQLLVPPWSKCLWGTIHLFTTHTHTQGQRESIWPWWHARSHWCLFFYISVFSIICKWVSYWSDSFMALSSIKSVIIAPLEINHVLIHSLKHIFQTGFYRNPSCIHINSDLL